MTSPNKKAPSLESKPEPATPERLLIRLDELADRLGISRRTLERERSAGRFPKADVRIGKMPLWRPETIREWIEGGGR